MDSKEKISHIIYKSFIGGIFWAAGASIGFAILIAILTFIFGRLGGLPLIGSFFADIVDSTNKALEIRKVMPR